MMNLQLRQLILQALTCYLEFSCICGYCAVWPMSVGCERSCLTCLFGSLPICMYSFCELCCKYITSVMERCTRLNQVLVELCCMLFALPSERSLRRYLGSDSENSALQVVQI